MSFNSLAFLAFLSITALCFSLLKPRWRYLLLLVASLGFYGALHEPVLLVSLGLISLSSFAIGLRMARGSVEKRGKWLLLGLAVNVVSLGLLKYLPAWTGDWLGLGAMGAIGVSYFVFQAMSYLIDIHLDLTEPEEDLRIFLLYMAFFPKLLQGPIERAADLIPQLKRDLSFDVFAGLPQFLWGLAKKIVIADRLALYVNVVYGNTHQHSGLTLLVATYVYAIQLYFDFSGYTDMALGVARMFGINLTQNFRRPYFARSIAEFWRRWHISFSRWILDYVFTPLQMRWRKLKTLGTASALLVTFVLSGIWHGPTFGFLIWGLLHGCYLACSVFYKPIQKRIHKTMGWEKSRLLAIGQGLVTFHLVCLAWVFFRADSVRTALDMLPRMMCPAGPLYLDDELHLLQGVPPAAFLLVVEAKGTWKWTNEPATDYYRVAGCAALVVAILLLGVFDGSQFIYFRF